MSETKTGGYCTQCCKRVVSPTNYVSYYQCGHKTCLPCGLTLIENKQRTCPECNECVHVSVFSEDFKSDGYQSCTCSCSFTTTDIYAANTHEMETRHAMLYSCHHANKSGYTGNSVSALVQHTIDALCEIRKKEDPRVLIYNTLREYKRCSFYKFE
jgi:hypothetical protein